MSLKQVLIHIVSGLRFRLFPWYVEPYGIVGMRT